MKLEKQQKMAKVFSTGANHTTTITNPQTPKLSYVTNQSKKTPATLSKDDKKYNKSNSYSSQSSLMST